MRFVFSIIYPIQKIFQEIQAVQVPMPIYDYDMISWKIQKEKGWLWQNVALTSALSRCPPHLRDRDYLLCREVVARSATRHCLVQWYLLLPT